MTSQERKAAQLTPRDLYRLRHCYLMAQRAALRAQYTQLHLQELNLELERRYGILTREAVLDIRTGAITETPSRSTPSDGNGKSPVRE